MLLDLIGYARCITASEFLDELSSLLSSKSQCSRLYKYRYDKGIFSNQHNAMVAYSNVSNSGVINGRLIHNNP